MDPHFGLFMSLAAHVLSRECGRDKNELHGIISFDVLEVTMMDEDLVYSYVLFNPCR